MATNDPSFDDLPLTDRARDAAHALGWRNPTPIQAAVIPQLSMGRDVIGRAQTGSGKTGAFGLILTDAVKAPGGLQALVLAPTRELCIQIARDLNDLAKDAPFRAVTVHGGVPYDPQIAALRAPETTCAVATTGRLLDLLSRGQVDLTNVRFVVLDEADRMLDLGFLPEVERILKLVPGARQTALFTATMPKKIAQLAHRYMSHPRDIEVGSTTPEQAQHFRVDVPSGDKQRALIGLVRSESPKRALVFVRTREGARDLAAALHMADVPAIAFHGDLVQEARERVVEMLTSGEARLVVATDVAARGLDIDGITHVINYDVPEEAETYVHRAGRTARAGKSGRVYTIVTENDGGHAEAAQKAAQLRWKPHLVEYERSDGEVIESRATPTPAKPEMRGGYARGARRKNAPTPPKPVRIADDPEPVTHEAEFDLPPSRSRKRRKS